eukprot:14536813-Ditylum_brightwellii.AAC.1
MISQPSAPHATATAHPFAASHNADTNDIDLENEDFSVADMSQAGISTLADDNMSTSQKISTVSNTEQSQLEIKQLHLAYPSHTDYIDFLLARGQP